MMTHPWRKTTSLLPGSYTLGVPTLTVRKRQTFVVYPVSREGVLIGYWLSRPTDTYFARHEWFIAQEIHDPMAEFSTTDITLAARRRKVR